MLFTKIAKFGLSALIASTALTSLSSPATAEAISTSNSESVMTLSYAQNDIDTQSVNPDLNGKWYLEWTEGGVKHQGKLLMNGDSGKLYVDTDVTRRPIRQNIRLQRTRNGFILQGSNPTHPNYSPDEFHFQLGNNPNDIINVENCSTGSCFPVKARQVWSR